MAGNSLVVAATDSSTPLQGTFLLDDVASLTTAIKNGDWVSGGLSAFSAAVDTAAAVSDPLGQLISAGLGWLMEHLEPLKGWLDDLTGDADQVKAFAGTWANIAKQLETSAGQLDGYLKDVDDLDGEAIAAYRAFQADVSKHLSSASTWGGAISTGLEVASTIVQIVHDVVRDAIAQIVGAIISYAAELVCSLGLATPLVIEQASTRVASVSTRVGESVSRGVESLKSLSGLLEKLKGLIKEAKDLFESVLRRSSEAKDVAAAVKKLPEELGDLFKQSTKTKAGRAFYAPGDDTVEMAKVLDPQPGKYTIDMHGDPAHVYFGNQQLEPSELAQMLKADPAYKGEPVYLMSCDTGQGVEPFAQKLADEMGVDVTAPTQLGWSGPDGKPFSSSLDPLTGGPTTPHDGTFTTFSPRSTTP